MHRRALLFALVLGWLASAAAQSNDNFAGRLTLSGASATAVSNNLSATRETNEPNHAAGAIGRSLWWTWTAPTSGVVNFSTFLGNGGITPPRALAVYTGDSLASLTEAGSSNDFDFYDEVVFTQRIALEATGTSFNLPVSAGTAYQIAVDASANFAGTDDGTVVLSINALPTIVSAASVATVTGAAFQYNILASNGPTVYGATNLPPGLSVNPTNGQINGVFTASGSYTVGLSAAGPGGMGTATLTLQVGDPAPVVVSPPVIDGYAAANGYVGASLYYYFEASGVPTSYTAANLPPGLTLDATYGEIEGTPTQAGTFTVPITATNAAGTGSATVTFNIAAAPLPPVFDGELADSATVGSLYSYHIFTYTEGVAATVTGYTATGLPPGLALDSNENITGTPTQTGVYPVAVSATNAGGTRTAIVTITVSNPTTPVSAAAPPQLESSATAVGIVGTALSYGLVATNTPTGFGASNLPSGLSIDPGSGAITGTPTAAGTFTVPVLATNAYGTSTATLTITIYANASAQLAANGTVVPVLTSPASASGYTGQSFTYTLSATYGGQGYFYPSSVWTYSASSLPPGLTLTNSANSYYGTATISGTPTAAGTYQATVSATFSSPYTYPSQPTATTTAIVTFIIKAGPVVSAPVFYGSATPSAVVGTALSYYPVVTGNPTSYAANGLPPGLSFNVSTGLLSGTPTTAGTYQTTLSATNSAGTGSATFTYIITPLTAPLVTSAATASWGLTGTASTYTITASPTATSFGAGTLPPGLTLNTSTGVISGTPTTAGVYTVPITATNAVGTGNATLTITVSATTTSAVPVIDGDAAQPGTVGSGFYYYFEGTNSPTSYAAGTLPPGLTLDATYGEIEGTPTTAGTYTVPISATNAAGTGSATVTLIIAPLPLPVLSGSAVVNATVNASISYYVSASNSPMAYAASGVPAGVTINTSTGYLSGSVATVGSYPVTVSATNASGTSSATLTLNIVPTPAPPLPVITSAAATTGVVGNAFSYAVQASGSPTSYALSSVPAGLTFNAATGALAGTPTATGTYPLTLSATNATGTGQATFKLVVTSAPTTPPTITSAAQTLVWQKQPFSYPIATSPAATSFTASNLPTGVTLNTATGLISGTLTSTGTYTVPISAANAVGTTAATVTITVSTPSVAVATNPAAVSAITGQAFSTTLTNCATSLYSTSASPLPTGLSVNSSTGLISGTPTVAGTTAVTTSQYTNLGYANAKLLITVASAAPTVPVISGAAGAGAYLGVPFAYALTATNSPTSFTAAGLPPGLTFNAATGLVSGTPTSTGTFTATVSASNAKGTSSYINLTFSVVQAPYSAITLTSPASVAGVIGSALSYTLTGNTYFYPQSASNLPPGLTFDTNAGIVSGTPTSSGVYATTFAIQSPYGTYIYPVVTFNIASTPYAAPVLTSPAGASGIIGTAFSYTVAASNAATTLAVSGLPGGLSFNAATGVVSGAPTASGLFSVPLTAANSVGQGSATLTLNIAAVAPAPPTLSTSNYLIKSSTVGSSVGVYIYASGNPVSYAASNLPPGLTLNTVTGLISGTTTAVGTYPVTISATNGAGTVSAVVTYVVSAVTAVPVFNDLDAESTGDSDVAFSTVYFYASNSPTSYAASNLPPGLSFDATAGKVTGTPTTAGVYRVNVSATNAAGTGSAVWTVVIYDSSGLRPAFSSASAAFGGGVGRTFSDTLPVTTLGGSSDATLPLTFTYSGLPPGLAGSASGTTYVYLTGTPTAAGTYPVTITATTPAGVSSSEVVTLVITSAPPAVTSAAAVAGNAGSFFSYALASASTVSSYAASNLPPGLSLNVTTGVISGTPTATGTYAAPVSATGIVGTGSAVVTFLIAAPAFGGLPVITSAAQTNCQDITSGSYVGPSYGTATGAFGYTITATNQPTSFGASNLPPGLTLNPSTGVIFGQPLVSGIFQVPITATNAAGTCGATLTINATASLPTLTNALTANGSVGAPFGYLIETPVTEDDYQFGLEESGINSDPLILAAAGLPPGLSVDTVTGYITGTPTRAGLYPVAISATNRAGTASAVVTILIAATAPPATTPPIFEGDDMAAGFVGFPLNYSLAAVYATSYTASGLPPGVVLDPVTGRITGTPTQTGTFSVPVSATNAAGTTQATLTVAIDATPPVPSIYSVAETSATVGTPFAYLIDAFAEEAPNVTAYGASNLPAGLSVNAQTGQIGGTPTGPAGTYLVPISAAIGTSVANATLTLMIQSTPASPTRPLLATPTGALGFVDNPLTYALGSTGFAPTSTLPTGLNFDAATGNITGYPAAAGPYQIALAASGAGGNSTAVLSLNILMPDLSLPRLTTQPSGVTVLQNGSASFAATAVGVPSPVYQWTHNGVPLAGANAATLTLPQAQPTDAGIYELTAANTAGQVTSVPVVLTVQQTYGTWQAAHFTAAEINGGLAADDYDATGDGVPNLIKYALGIDPKDGTGGSLPVGTYGTADRALHLAFSRDVERTDINYVVEASSDLAQWTPIASSTAGAPTANLGGALMVTENVITGTSQVNVVVEDGQSAGTAGQRFLRLQVVRP